MRPCPTRRPAGAVPIGRGPACSRAPTRPSPPGRRAAALAGLETAPRVARVVRAGAEEAVDELLTFLADRGYRDEDGAAG